jgi:hypothetical protein
MNMCWIFLLDRHLNVGQKAVDETDPTCKSSKSCFPTFPFRQIFLRNWKIAWT